MKKVFLSALAVCGFAFAQAQNHSSNSSSSTGLAPAVNATAPINLTLHNAIEITPATSGAFEATFETVADYNAIHKYMGQHTWNVKSTRGGNISVNVSDLSDGSTSIPASKMAYSTSGTAGSGPFTPISSNNLGNVGTFSSGDSNPFKFALEVHPGWSYGGGVYTGTVTITATQL